MPFDEAVQFAANSLFASPNVAKFAGARDRYPLVIDPLVDGNSGVQSVATRTMESRISQLVQSKYPKYDLQPFTSANLVRAPLVFIGTFTAVDKEGKNVGDRDWYRVCLALLDLRTGMIVAKGFARAAKEGVDPTPLQVFLDMPAWAPDPTTQGYVTSCQGPVAGDPIKPAYLDRIYAAAQIDEAFKAYDAGRYEDALDILKGVQRTPAGNQLRVYNGIYVASNKLGRRREAEEAFARVVDFGFAQKRLGVNLLFQPATTVFLPDPRVSAAYPSWLKTIARKATGANTCIEVSGHTSRTGSEPINDRLSLARADYVRTLLVKDAPALKQRTKAVGKGWRENLSGIGTDDRRDALDRRVEFKPGEC
ncbi:MAG: OmpA family protein [Pseudomonadota bacterium]|nr:OmpA family protein [Pseudomonadota bacterium]